MERPLIRGTSNERHDSNWRRLRLLGRLRRRAGAARTKWRHRLSHPRLPGRDHHVDPGACQGAQARTWLCHRLCFAGHRAAGEGIAREKNQGRRQRRRLQPAGLLRGAGTRIAARRRAAAGGGRAGRRCRTAGRQPAPGGHDPGDVHRRSAAGAGADRECLHRRVPHRAGAGCRRRHRRHRPLRRQRARTGTVDPRIRLAPGRLGLACRRLAGRPRHRVRRAGHRRLLHRLGRRGGRLGRHGLSHCRVQARRQLHHHQAAGHGRPRELRHRCRTDHLRNRRPGGLRPPGRGLRPDPGPCGRDRPRRSRGDRRPWPAGHINLQGVGHDSRWLPQPGDAVCPRHGRCRKGPRHGPSHPPAQPTPDACGRIRRLHPHLHRGPWRRRSVWSARGPAPMARSGHEGRGAPCQRQGTGDLLARDLPRRHRDGTRHRRHFWRAPQGPAGDAAVFLSP